MKPPRSASSPHPHPTDYRSSEADVKTHETPPPHPRLHPPRLLRGQGAAACNWSHKMRAIVTFQGFTESAAERTGTENLYFEVVRKFSGGEILTMAPMPWTADVDILAAQISRQGIREICIISYSHGQAAATDFARECYGLGISVTLWLACDPVYRPDWLPRWGWWTQPLAFRALTAGVKIKAPKGIARIRYVTQSVKWPFGHEVIPFDDNTKVDRTILHYPHTAIDEHPTWFRIVKHELETWCSPPKATIV